LNAGQVPAIQELSLLQMLDAWHHNGW